MTDDDSVDSARNPFAEYIRYDWLGRKHSSIGYLTPVQFATCAMARN